MFHFAHAALQATESPHPAMKGKWWAKHHINCDSSQSQETETAHFIRLGNLLSCVVPCHQVFVR